MPSPDTRKNMLSAGALVLPIILVKMATTFLGHSAATAQASPRPAAANSTTAPTAISLVKITPRQIAAATYVESLRGVAFGPVPMLFEPKPVKSGANDPDTASTPVQDTRPNKPLPKFTLNAVMSSATGQRAVINGRPYRIGDTIYDTMWIVSAIDVDARSATLSDTQGDRTVVIAVDLPQ